MIDTAKDQPWPVTIRLNTTRSVLVVEFDNGQTREWTAEKLRVESPSAEVQGHHPSQKVHVTGKEHVTIRRIEPVGNYAVRLEFDDGHDSGIYTWNYLYATA